MLLSLAASTTGPSTSLDASRPSAGTRTLAGPVSEHKSGIKAETKVETKSEPVVSLSATDWLDEADDWGDDPNDNDDNGNFSCISPDTSSPSPVGAAGGFPTSNLNLNDKLFNAFDGDTTLDIPISNLNIKDDKSHGRSGKNLNDKNANMSSPGRGASAPHGSAAATAEIEMEGEDSILLLTVLRLLTPTYLICLPLLPERCPVLGSRLNLLHLVPRRTLSPKISEQ
eukprot:TRINITY_DN9174_c0_g1_i1.p1 TRINITY_DN9174_c0_g1~~TRINITY_DN9174_c0_g1_i1.p1  ORF type:complete len:227 (-),score=57.77 TRINITY_DN9174_c0_g1_i1:172-852(-)